MPSPVASLAGKPAGKTDLVPAATLPVRSAGVALGSSWTLDENGYVGAFLRVAEQGPVTVTVTASGLADRGTAPQMKIVLGGAASAFEIPSTRSNYVHRAVLPAGTYFVRVEQTGSPPRANRQLTIAGLSVAGAALVPEATDQLALAAAETTIEHFRRGRARVTLPGAKPGDRVRVKLVRHAFNFGVNMPGAENRMIPAVLAPGSDAELYQRFVLANFNTVVLSNAGKWAYHEAKRDQVTLEHVDRFFGFTQKHGLRARMHTLLWDTQQQPSWVSDVDPKKPGLISSALRGDSRAKLELTQEIDERIQYYVRDRARGYFELDVINESVHRSRYLELYGAPGIAEIFNRTARALKEGGATTRLCLNEYNLLQWSKDPRSGAPDPYANWYRRHADAILAAGGAVDTLGVQYYPDGRDESLIGASAHSAARVFAVLENLATTGLRLSLTEFTVSSKNSTVERAGLILEQTLRLVFGNPQADTFMIWAIWERAAEPPPPASALIDAQGNLTEPGRRYQALMRAWDTNLELVAGADGSVVFDGFYGDYSVTLAEKSHALSLVRGKSDYLVTQ